MVMRILVVGAGALGGYFGGRLLEKGEDVTFLVREKRKAQLEADGLVVESVNGNMKMNVKTLLSGEQSDLFDVIILSTKAYHLEGAIESIRPYVSEQTMILPLLNGIEHISTLIDSFGEKHVIGGMCAIEATLDQTGKIIQDSVLHEFVYGERNGEKTERILKLQEAFSGTKADFRLSENIEQDMWHKYLFISTVAGVTSLFRSPMGPIREQKYGKQVIQSILTEAVSIMRAIKAPILDNVEDLQKERLNKLGYKMKASLLKDMEKQLPIEADHFFGYLLEQAETSGVEAKTIEPVYANLKLYETNTL